MAHSMVEANRDGLRVDSDRRLKLEFHGPKITSDSGLLAYRELDDALVLSEVAGAFFQDCRTGKNAVKWTRLSCRKFRNNDVRLQLHALACMFANFMRSLALPKEVGCWSLTMLREKPVKIGAKVVSHDRYVTFQLAEVAIPRPVFANILRLIDGLRPAALPP